MKTAVILDCDNTAGLPGYEIDDALALLSLVADPAVELVGVTTTFGNGSLDEVLSQTHWFLEAIGRPDVPIFPGARRAGDFDTEAADFLARTCTARRGEIHVIAIGPLGNIAGAGAANSRFYDSVVGIYAMGGYTRPLRFPKREVAELNLSCDPQAAYSVLRSRAPVHLMSAQLCLNLPFRRADFAGIAETPHWFQDMVAGWFLTFSTSIGVDAFYLWDLLAVIKLGSIGLRGTGRLPDRRVRIQSTVDDLATGTLRWEPAESADLATERIVNLPEHLYDVEEVRRELAAGWNRGLSQGDGHT